MAARVALKNTTCARAPWNLAFAVVGSADHGVRFDREPRLGWGAVLRNAGLQPPDGEGGGAPVNLDFRGGRNGVLLGGAVFRDAGLQPPDGEGGSAPVSLDF